MELNPQPQPQLPTRQNMNQPKLLNIEPATRRLLPGFSVSMTSALWQAIAGADPLTFDDERLRDVGFYVLFALAGWIGARDGRNRDCQTLLVPVAFDTEVAEMRITMVTQTTDHAALVLSLPGETPRTQS